MSLKYPADWLKYKQEKKKISILTVYDACFSRLLSQSSLDAMLIGDSLGMVVQGHTSTLPVTLDEMIYHSKMCRRGAPNSFLIADLPFGTFQENAQQTIHNAIKLYKESGVDAIKIEGAEHETLQAIEKLAASGVPIMGHLGLEPQKFRTLGGYKIQGRKDKEIKVLTESAKSLEGVGCFGLILELVLAPIAKKITQNLAIPTIGIGSGVDCDGQILVLNDFLHLNSEFQTKHTKSYLPLGEKIISAINLYTKEVQEGSFPSKEHYFTS